MTTMTEHRAASADIAARATARYGRAVTLCARHALSDDYNPRRAREIDQTARGAAHLAAKHGAYAPLIDRLERVLGIDGDEGDA